MIVFGAALGVGAALLLPNALNWRSDSPYLDSMRGVVNSQDGSGRGRLMQYRTTLRVALAHPLLGVGPGNWPVWYPRHAARGDPSLGQSDGMTANPWPSSDWMALLSERGMPAAVCLALAVLGLGLGALIALPRARRTDDLLRPITLLLVLAAVIVVSSFDAALLLPAPALVVWALLGALAPAAPARITFNLMGRRVWWVLGVLVVGAVASARSASQIAAMAAFGDGGSRVAMERAAQLDPGNYRVHLRLAQSDAKRGRCAGVRLHAVRALALFPNAPEPRRLLSACGGRGRTG
jgi:O-antigen ligase